MHIKKYLNRYKNLWIIIGLILVIKIFSSDSLLVESFYSTGFYLYFSGILRFLSGWIPFSIGDILYFIAGSWLLFKLIKNIRLLWKRKLSMKIILGKFYKLILLFGCLYIVFNIFWGINYNRKGIAYQLKLSNLQYDSADLKMMQAILLQKVNSTRMAVTRHYIYFSSKDEII